jgi:Xaa-Pro aminopeptidase
MSGPSPKFELSQVEKERRYNLLRDKLKRNGLSALIVYGGTQMGVPLHYLTQVWGNRNNLVIFPVEGEPILLIPSNSIVNVAQIVKQGCWITEENIHLSAIPAADAAKIIKKLKLQNTKIGVDSFRFWPMFEYQTFMEICPKAQIVEARRLFGEIRGSKSDEELAIMQNAIQISDMAHYAFLATVKSGMTELEAAARAVEVLDTHGIGDRIVLIHTRPEATYPNRPGPTIIQKPNPITFSPEFTRSLGYGAQMIRAYWWEKPQGIYQRMFELWAEMRKMIVQEFRPGVEITDGGKKIVKLIESYGFECDKLGHAVGLAYGDAPYITAGPDEKDYEEWTIQTNEVYAVHPMVRCKGYKAPFSMIGDMYLIGKDSTKWMTTKLPGLPEMIPF